MNDVRKEAEKPFIMYRLGPGNFKIVPRNAKGWRETILWTLMVLPIIGGFIGFALTEPEQTGFVVAIILFAVAMLAWGIGGIIWMRRRSEVIDFEELLAIKRERDRAANTRRRS